MHKYTLHTLHATVDHICYKCLHLLNNFLICTFWVGNQYTFENNIKPEMNSIDEYDCCKLNVIFLVLNFEFFNKSLLPSGEISFL